MWQVGMVLCSLCSWFVNGNWKGDDAGVVVRCALEGSEVV